MSEKAEKNKLWYLKDVCVISNKEEYIKHCSPQATRELLRLKIVVVVNINPFTIQMNEDYKNQIQEAEDLAKEKAEKKKQSRRKAEKKYHEQKRKPKREKEKLQKTLKNQKNKG